MNSLCAKDRLRRKRPRSWLISEITSLSSRTFLPASALSVGMDTSYSDEVARVLEQIVESLRHAPTEMSVVSYAHRPAA